MPWYRANFHCHSTNSDGRVSPLEAAAYYRSIGMHAVTLSDHNRLTAPAEYDSALGSDCIAVPCCEYTGSSSAHVLGVDVREAAAPSGNQSEWEVVDILRDGVDRVRAAVGVPVLCHPCWNWAWDHEAIFALPEATHFEVFNASPDCNSYPTGDRSAPEEIWDRVLSTGRLIYGVGSDDAHRYATQTDDGRLPGHLSLAGLGWSVIDAPELTRKALRAAFEAGRFYVSTGVELADYRVTAEGISLEVKPWSHERVTVEFVGFEGRTLAREEGPRATYRFRGDERYVRVRIADTSGCYAFTQAVFLDAARARGR